MIVAIATRQQDPTTFAAWTAARRIEGQREGNAKAPVPAPDPVVPVPPVPPTSPAVPEAEPAMMSMVALEKAS